MTVHEMIASIPPFVAWLAELGYQPEQVKTLHIESPARRDYKREQETQGNWKYFKPGKRAHVLLVMEDYRLYQQTFRLPGLKPIGARAQ